MPNYLSWILTQLVIVVSGVLIGLSPVQANPLLIGEIDNALKTRCLSPTKTAVSIVELPTGNTVYARNVHESLLPASIMKIVTTAAALHYLGPEYRFTTRFLTNGSRVGNQIQGDLIIKGGGDPSLLPEHLWLIANRLKASGIQEITGNLLVDAHFFDQHDRAPSWTQEMTQYSYDAKLAAFSLNFNTLSVRVLPGTQVGSELTVWLEPAPGYMKLSNYGKTIAQGRNTVSISRKETEWGDSEVVVNGRLPLGSAEKVVNLTIENPLRYAGEAFRAFLAQAGIGVRGTTQIVNTDAFGTELYLHSSVPISLILKNLNTYSNNFTAEQIVKTIAAERYGTPGSHAEGLRLVTDFLRIIGVDTQNLVLADGSGLSRKNRFTAKAMTDLLAAMYPRFDTGPDFLASLRVMGAYGVLSNRLAQSPAQGQIRAKTGTLNGVSTLAGYVASPGNKVFAYALFLNDNRCGYYGADKVEDRIVNAIHTYGNNMLLTTVGPGSTMGPSQ